MAKRRNKAKAKRRFAGLERKVKINEEMVEKMMKLETKANQESVHDSKESCDLSEIVQVTESDLVSNSVTENNKLSEKTNETGVKKMFSPRGRKPNKKKLKRSQNTENVFRKSCENIPSDEVLIHPKEVDGETCIEINCGNNDALLYLSKLVLGSKGACIHHSGSWLTPNEFQTVSGRETAKDWKRSIRHKGRSLKMLISKGLITVQSVSPKKNKENPSPQDMGLSIQKKSVAIDTMVTTKAKDDVNTVGNEVKTTSDETPVNVPTLPKKRGRKPKRLRNRNAAAARNVKKTMQENLANATLPLSVKESLEKKKADDKIPSTDCGEKNSDVIETIDPQAEEERRLAEFVKSLRLTKTVVPVKTAPVLSDAETVKEVDEHIVEDDPEMPVLQKEEDILPGVPAALANDHVNISVGVDTFHATVTPPPTPPGEEILIERKTDDEKLGDTFRSRLMSPSNGIKLTINRDKSNIDVNEKANNEIKPYQDVNTESKMNEPNIQTLLLQDALQSAKKYKEQLKQNMQQLSPPKPVIRVPDVKCKTDDLKTMEKSLRTTTQPPVSHKTSNNALQQVARNGCDRIVPTCHDKVDRQHMSQNKTKQHAHTIGAPNGLPHIDFKQNQSGASLHDVMANMASMHGPHPFPVDSSDTTLTTLQEMYRQQEMLRMLSHGQANGMSSAMLNPMMTQQLLLTMTQQLYSMYNMSGWVPQTKSPASTTKSYLPKISPSTQLPEIHHRNSSRNPDSRLSVKHHDVNHRMSSKTPEFNNRHLSRVPEIPKLHSSRLGDMHQRHLSHVPDFRQPHNSINPHEIPLLRTVQSDSGHSPREQLVKRKHSELDSDGAIDLSVKRTRTENVKSEKIRSDNSNNSAGGYDLPLDFSMKKTKTLEDRFNKSIDKGMINGSLDLFGRQVPSYKMPGSIPKVCTCERTKENHISNWSVERVCHFLKDLDGCAQYVKTFHDQGINGRLLPHLTPQHLTRTLGMKVGPALTLIQAVEHKLKERLTPIPRHHCQLHSQTFTTPVHI